MLLAVRLASGYLKSIVRCPPDSGGDALILGVPSPAMPRCRTTTCCTVSDCRTGSPIFQCWEERASIRCVDVPSPEYACRIKLRKPLTAAKPSVEGVKASLRLPAMHHVSGACTYLKVVISSCAIPVLFPVYPLPFSRSRAMPHPQSSGRCSFPRYGTLVGPLLTTYLATCLPGPTVSAHWRLEHALVACRWGLCR